MSISLLQNENDKKVKLVERPFKDFYLWLRNVTDNIGGGGSFIFLFD